MILSPIPVGELESGPSLTLKFSWDSLLKDSPWGHFFRNRFKISMDTFSQTYKYKYKRSSVWPGIKAVLPTLFSGAKWVVGNGRQIPFWTGKWLDEPILTMLGLQHSSSSTMVDVVINNQQWALPNHFTTCFPDIANTITQVVLPASPTEDKLVWEPACNGDLKFSDCYNAFRKQSSAVSWAKLIWKNYIPPKFSHCVF